MKIWAQKNNKTTLGCHFYSCKILGKTFNIVRLEAESCGIIGNKNKWDVFMFPNSQEGDVVHSFYSDNQSKEMTRYGGRPGYFVVRMSVPTPIGEEKETFFPEWKGVSFKNLNSEQLGLVIEVAKEAESSGFGTHGKFLYLEEFLKTV